ARARARGSHRARRGSPPASRRRWASPASLRSRLPAAVARNRVGQVEERAEAALAGVSDVVDADLVRVRVDAHVRCVLLAEHEQAHRPVATVLVPVHPAFAAWEGNDPAFGYVLPLARG